MKHCAGHTRHFPHESLYRPLGDFNKYYDGYQPQCRRCNDADMVRFNPATNADPYRSALAWVHERFPGERVGRKHYPYWEAAHPG